MTIVENFDRPPYYNQNYNPAYYVPFFRKYGFETKFKQFIYYRKVNDKLQDKFIDRANNIYANPDYHFEHIKKNQANKYAEDFRQIYNRAWANRDGLAFKSMQAAQARAIIKQMKPIIDEKITHFAYYKNKPVAFYISLPEINQIFKKFNGKFHWWNKLRFLFYLKTGVCKTSFGLAFGIDPDHQGKGMEGALFDQIAKHMQHTNTYEDVVITWIGDFNPKMINIIENLGARKIQTMETLEKEF